MTQSPISILFVDHAEALGGAERSLLTLLRHLDRSRFTPLLACNPGPLPQAAQALGVKTIIVPMPRLRGSLAAPWHLARGSIALARIVRREGVALVHSNVMRASFYAAAAARLTGRPLVWHVRDIHHESWYLRLMCRLSERAIAISQAVAAPIPCRHKTTVVYNGLDPERFDPELDGSPFRTELNVPDGVPLIGCVGRLRQWKGQDHVLEMAALVARQQPDARFVVVGATIFPSGRDYLAELKDLADRLGIANRVIFAGYRDDVPRVLAGLDLLVHAAEAEPFGRVVIEAMAMARPVVAFADGGVPEIVLDGETGRLVPPGDVAALADAVVALLQDPERRGAMGRAGRQRVQSYFDARQMARRVETVYSQVLMGR